MSTVRREIAKLRQHSVWQRTYSEEFINSVTHGFGLVLAVLGGLVMIWSVLRHGDGWRITGCAIYAASLVAVYGASTLSHSVTDVRRKIFYRRLDQGCIYFLIVATYTPFGLAYWRTDAGHVNFSSTIEMKRSSGWRWWPSSQLRPWKRRIAPHSSTARSRTRARARDMGGFGNRQLAETRRPLRARKRPISSRLPWIHSSRRSTPSSGEIRGFQSSSRSARDTLQ